MPPLHRILALYLTSLLFVGALSAQKAPNPVAGFMVAGGFGSLSGDGGTSGFPLVHLAGTSSAGWGGDLGVGVHFGDETGVLIDLSFTHVFASEASNIGVMVLLGPSLISEGGEVFGISGGAALLVRLGSHVGLRIDATPRLYFDDSNGTKPAIVIAASITSLPGWNHAR